MLVLGCVIGTPFWGIKQSVGKLPLSHYGTTQKKPCIQHFTSKFMKIHGTVCLGGSDQQKFMQLKWWLEALPSCSDGILFRCSTSSAGVDNYTLGS